MSDAPQRPRKVSDRIPGHKPVPRYRATHGPALLSQGFRPFFLFAGLWSALALGAWLAALAVGVGLPMAFDPVAWHMHEMIFGFAVAAVAGFLLTAIPNWTGRLPLQGLPLAVLAALWLAGRVAMAWPALPPAALAAVDLAFLAALTAACLREVLAGRNWHNLPIIAALMLLLAANAMTHAAQSGAVTADGTGARLGVATLSMLVALVGGRVVPSFTRNWLSKAGAERLPAPAGWFDTVCLLATAVALAVWTIVPDGTPTGVLCCLAGVLLAIRLARWRGLATLGEPLLAVLHLGYAWLAAGLLLTGAAGIFPETVPAAAGLHALTAGAVGTMTLAVMTRASLGHSGRALTADTATLGVFAAVTGAALARVAAAFLPEAYLELLTASGLLWVAAFTLFTLRYAPIFLRPDPRHVARTQARASARDA